MSGGTKKGTLNKMQLKFVANWKGDGAEAARKAGYKNPKQLAYKLMRKPAVKKAIAAKQQTVVEQSGKQLGRQITITRNDIIMGLADIAQSGETDGARVAAYRELKDIFGLSAKKDVDIFAGWSDDELDYYTRTGDIPPDRR